mmetsp:Transcript_73826/g.205300  ORF Transcript_73826/g.205300 Transcript_73826/m.205300 type:complete len:146 (-) Transcript_73826:1571-2008(-)
MSSIAAAGADRTPPWVTVGVVLLELETWGLVFGFVRMAEPACATNDGNGGGGMSATAATGGAECTPLNLAVAIVDSSPTAEVAAFAAPNGLIEGVDADMGAAGAGGAAANGGGGGGMSSIADTDIACAPPTFEAVAAPSVAAPLD